MDYHYILLNVDKPLYRYDFHPNHPLILGKNPEIGLKSISIQITRIKIGKPANSHCTRRAKLCQIF